MATVTRIRSASAKVLGAARRSGLVALAAAVVVLPITAAVTASAPRQVADTSPAPKGKKLGTAQAHFLAAERLPVVFLPGVAGSTLYDKPIVGDQLWPLSPSAKRAALQLSPDGTSPDSHVTAYDIVRKGDANFSRLANVYGGMVDFFESRGQKEGTDLVLFPYDWRLNNGTHFDRLDVTVRNALGATGQKKVVLLGHSMGGVIARAYVLSKPDRAATVDSLITMGTPYWGSPKVYYAMIEGYAFGNTTVRQEYMKILVRNMPAGYQLLPTEPFIVDKTRRVCPSGIPRFCPDNYLTLGESYSVRYKWFTQIEAGMPFDVYVPTANNIQTLNQELLKLAKTFHAPGGAMANPTRLPGDVKQYAIIGYGVSTLSRYWMRDADAGEVSRGRYLDFGDGRAVVMEPQFDDGDGTVPLWGLRIAGATKTYYVPHKGNLMVPGKGVGSAVHGELPLNATVQGIVAQILDNKVPDEAQFAYSEQHTVAVESLDLTLPSQ